MRTAVDGRNDALQTLLAQSGFEVTSLRHKRDGSLAVEVKPRDPVARIACDDERQSLVINDEVLPLAPVAYAIASSLVAARGSVVLGETMTRKIWGTFSPATKNRLSVHMHHLRRTLAEHGVRQAIRNVHGFGFYLT